MALRKEQTLALAVLALGALVFYGRDSEVPMVATITMKPLQYEPKTTAAARLAAERAGELLRADFATEPRETQPLPPRDLVYPPRASRSLLGMPLDIGPDLGHALALAVDGAPLSGVTLAEPALAAAVPPEPSAEVAVQGTRAEREAIAAASYDRVYLHGLTAPFFGTVEVDGMDRFDLETKQSFDGIKVRLRTYNVDTGKVGRSVVFGDDDRQKISKVVLAGNLRNEIQRRTRGIPVDGAHLSERSAVIAWLLEQAEQDSSVYKDAMQQAELYLQAAGGDLQGLRWQQRVLQASGDLAGEFALLNGLSGPYRESPFRYTGLGVLKAKLGLRMAAEADLRQAVQLGPNEPRAHQALAQFLLGSGRAHEAVAACRRAEQSLGLVSDASERDQIASTIVACHLAVDDVASAQTALRNVAGADKVYLDGVVRYAQGDVTGALTALRAASGRQAGAARLGQAACLLRLGNWQEAYDTLLAVYDAEPLLRHRAAAGVAFLLLRLERWVDALAWLDRSQEADPSDPYAHYLRGAVLLRMGDLQGAETALLNCLRLRDDFVHALVEMSALLAKRAVDQDRPDAAKSALRYAARAVRLAHKSSVELHELHGLMADLDGDLRTAQQAFQACVELAHDERGKLAARGALAVVAYARGQREEAEATLLRMSTDLPKDDALRQWAEARLQEIDDHGQKELLSDRFERSDVGGVWSGERDGNLGAVLRDGQLLFRGAFTRNGQGEVYVRRQGAVAKGKNFLAVACRMQLGEHQPKHEGFAGLRIGTQRGAAQSYDLRVQLGLRDGAPYLLLEENREEAVRVALEVPDFNITDWQELELRVLSRGDAGRNFMLQVVWNGHLLRAIELKTLTANTGNELETALFVSGGRGSEVEVRFDDYRLQRRKDR